MPFKVLIIGGSGEMGRWAANQFKHMGFDVSISSRRDVSDLAASMGVSSAPQSAAGVFDIVVMSVPIDRIEEVSADVGQRMRPGSLLMDLCSLKKGPVESMLYHTPPDVEVIGTHPLFGPSIDSIKGRTVVLVPTSRCSKWFPVIHDLFQDTGANIEVTNSEDHDKKMAIVQGLSHFIYISFGRTLEAIDVRVKDLDPYGTPVFGVTKDLAGRVLSQDPDLYTLIQSGEYVRHVRHAYIVACSELASYMDLGEREEFIKAIKSAARHYGDTAGARKRSDRIIRKEMEDKISIMDSVGQERAFMIDGGKETVYGIVREAGRDEFVLETASRKMSFSYDDVTLISHEELNELKSRIAPRISRDIHVKLPIGVNARMLRWVLTRIDGVADVRMETSDALNPENVIYRFTVEAYSDASEDTLHKVLSTIWELGYEVK